ncbi:unnamed protein product [Paramecium primaurelia]|uniref:Uncharacterized protein n=1 Tax=Paramecium primaurelia TaxID=5886 RepID=A0A8S1N6E7_PARPR|nr:unnamed protein product [Paramecium primaurelia]
MSTKSQLTFQILIIGSAAVGKTAIVKQYIDSNINNIEITIGSEWNKKDIIINKKMVTLSLWELNSFARQHVIFQKVDCCIIVFNINDIEPTKTLDLWKNIYQQQRIQEDPENSIIFIIQNDFVENNEIIKSHLVEQWCKQNRIKQLFKISANDNLIVNETFFEITKILLREKQNFINKSNKAINQKDDFLNVKSFENMMVKQQLKCNMQETIDSLKCYNQHDSPPIIVLLDDNLKGVQRLICSQCIIDIRGRFNGINIDEAIFQIEDRKNNFLNEISDFNQKILNILNSFKDQILQNRNEIIQTMDQMINQVDNWIGDIQQFEQKQCSYKFLDEIDKLNHFVEQVKNDQINEFKNVIFTINQAYEKKIQLSKLILREQFLQAQNNLRLHSSNVSFKRLNSEVTKDDVETKTYNQIQYQLVQEVKQKDWCHALAFNYDESIMAGSIGKSIKLWKFQQGQLQDNNIVLDGHEKLIKCIVFSKKNNWFFTGSEDNTIRSWKEKQGWFSSSKWESVKANKAHQDWVIQLILNEQNNELISCSVDKTIKIWRVSYDSNSIKFLESLEIHQEQILSISLNQSQQQLISWGEDKQVILWEKNQQQKWQFKNKILLSIQEINRGARFLMDNQIICKTSKGQIENYILEKDKYQQKQVLDFNVENPDFNPQECQIIFNIQTQLIVMKHHKYFYFFRNNLDECKFEQVCKPLECQKEVCFFNITNDGKYLVLWIWYPVLRFKIYELIYSNQY